MAKMRTASEDLKSMQEITPGLRKRLLRVGDTMEEGGGRGRPTAGAIVTIQYVATLYPDGKAPFASTREYIAPLNQSLTAKESNRVTVPGPYTFTLGQGTVVPAWDIAVQTMTIGEAADFVAAPPMAYGENGAPHLGVPPNYPIRYAIELVDWKPARTARRTLTNAARLEEAARHKSEGTTSFQAGQWQPALDSYDSSAYFIADAFFGSDYLDDAPAEESIPSEPPTAEKPPPALPFAEGTESREPAKALLLSALLNATQCALKLHEWRGAEKRASKVLQLEGKNIKALYRRGLARTQLGDFGDARADLRKACELDPKSKEIRAAFDECKRAEAEAKAATKALYANTGAADGRGYEAPPPAEEDPLFVY